MRSAGCANRLWHSLHVKPNMRLRLMRARKLNLFATFVMIWVLLFKADWFWLWITQHAFIANDVGVSARTKHFDRAIHYVRDLTQLRRVLPTYVSTDTQRADGYTKSLDKSKYFAWLRSVFPV